MNITINLKPLIILSIPLVSECDTFLEGGFSFPAEIVDPRYIHDLAGCAIGFGGIVNNLAREAGGFRDQLRKLCNCEINAGTYIKVG